MRCKSFNLRGFEAVQNHEWSKDTVLCVFVRCSILHDNMLIKKFKLLKISILGSYPLHYIYV